MSVTLLSALLATIVATSFLSGIFGMAGGLILMGVLLAIMPLPETMALHAVTQMASNGWRGLLWWKFIRWRAAANFLTGCAVAFIAWSFWRYIPSKSIALLLLGVSPFLFRLLPANLKPDPERLTHGILYGSACMTLMLLAGVTGPLVDSFFLGGALERRQIVATKAACQIFSHGAKFVYFGGIVEQAASVDPTIAAMAIIASMIGTSLARPVMERLTDVQYRTWATHMITVIACVFLAQAGYLLARPYF